MTYPENRRTVQPSTERLVWRSDFDSEGEEMRLSMGMLLPAYSR